MKATAKHLLVEYQGCDCDILNARDKIERIMQKAASAANATIVNSVFHTYTPQGVSGVVVIEESHLSIHTWPEYGYAAVDFFTCGECDPEASHRVLLEELKAENSETMMVVRGSLHKKPTMNVIRHQIDDNNLKASVESSFTISTQSVATRAEN